MVWNPQSEPFLLNLRWNHLKKSARSGPGKHLGCQPISETCSGGTTYPRTSWVDHRNAPFWTYEKFCLRGQLIRESWGGYYKFSQKGSRTPKISCLAVKNLTFWRSDTSTTILLHQKVQLDKFVTPRKRVDHPMQTLWENRAFCTKKMLLRAKQFMSQESMWRCQMGCGAPKCWLKRLTSSPGLHMTKKPFRDVTTSLSCTFWRGKSG